MYWKLRSLETPLDTFSCVEINLILKNCKNSTEFYKCLNILFMYYDVGEVVMEFITCIANHVHTKMQMQIFSYWLIELFPIESNPEFKNKVTEIIVKRILELKKQGLYDIS